MSQPKIRVVIADDHAILRAGLRMLLSAQSDMEVLAEAENGTQTLDVIGSTQPDVLLLDISMPDTDAVDLIRRISRSSPFTRVLVLTMHSEAGYLDSMLRAGVSGYLLKRALHSDLVTSLREIAAGRMFIDPRLSKTLVERSLGKARSLNSAPEVAFELLSAREKQVLQLAARGFLNRQIAARMHIGEKSVEKYRSRIFKKLKLRDRAELVDFALRLGLLANSF